MKADNQRKADPEKYLKLNKPFPSTVAVDKALQAFFDGVGKLREEFGIPDVFMVLRLPYFGDDQLPREALLPLAFGDERNMESLAAMGLGWAQKCRQEMIGDIMARPGAIMRPKES